MSGAIRVKKSFSIQELFLAGATVCVVLYALLEHVSISIAAYSSVKLPMLYAGGLCLLPQISLIFKEVLRKKNFAVLLTVIFICLFVRMSMEMNPQSAAVTRGTTRFMLYMIELFTLAVIYVVQGKVESLVRFIFGCVVAITVLTDSLFLTKLITFRNGKFETYLIGTKFSLSYMHMNLLTFWVLRNLMLGRMQQTTNTKIILGSGLCACISLYTDCMTGMIGVIVLAVLLVRMVLNRKHTGEMLGTSRMIALCVAGSLMFAFVIDGLVSIPFIADIIENIMGRSLTLTGRLNIYRQYLQEMEGRWLWGHGLGNGYAAASTIFGYANTQNALMDWIFQTGLPTSVGLIALMMLIFKRVEAAAKERRELAMPLILLIYTYVVMGTVEITFDMDFFMWLAVLFAIVNSTREKHTV